MMHLWPKWYLKAAVAMLAMLALGACTSATPASPTPIPTPTPATPTATPTPAVGAPYWPSYLDLDMVANLKTQGYSQGAYDYSVIKRYYPAFAAIYVARECFAGNPLTVEGFRTFVGQTAAQTRAMNIRDANALVAAQARDAAGRLLALQGKDVRGSCIEPFMYPKTGAEAQLGQALFTSAVIGEAKFGGPGIDFLIEKGLHLTAAAQWFQQEAQSREPFVPWLWDTPIGPAYQLDPLAQIAGNVPVPKGATQLPITWATDYQLSVMQMINVQQANAISDQANTISQLCSQVSEWQGRDIFSFFAMCN